MPQNTSPIATAFLDSLQEEYPEEFSPETPATKLRQFRKDHEDELERLQEVVREETVDCSYSETTNKYLNIANPYEREETIE